MKQNLKRALWMLISIAAISVNSALALEVEIDGLAYELSGVSAKVTHVASGNKNSTIQIPSTVNYEGLTYTVNEIGSKCFVNFDVSYHNPMYYYNHYEDGKCIENVSQYTNSPDGINRNAPLREHEEWAIANSYVKKVILPETIVQIRSNAFCNSQIHSVEIKAGVQIIDDYAFNTPNLAQIKLPSSLLSVGERAFYKTKLKEIFIPSSVASLGKNSFEGCSLLRKITYMGATPPSEWAATAFTCVPSKKTYGNPSYSINNANIIEMISFSDDTFAYTGKTPNVTWTNNMEGYTAKLTMPTLHSEVGTYEEIIPATFTNGAETFTAYIPYSYTIEPVKLTAKVNKANRVYGEDNPTFTISYTGFVNGENESVLTTKPAITTTATKNSEVGTYPISISGGEAKNYTIEYEEGTLTVNKAPLTINVDDASKVYGKENPAFSLNYSGLKNGETSPAWETKPTFTTAATKTSDVGTYDVKVTCNPKNYSATIKNGKLKVTQAPLSIGVKNATRPYCGKDPDYIYTYSGFVNGDDENVLTRKPSIKTEATKTSNVGDYTITPTGAQAKNYDITYKDGTLNITQVPLTVKAVSETRDYGKENPVLSLIYEGFVNNENKDVLLSQPTVSTSANINSNAGTYDIRVSGGRAFNYALKYESGQLTIKPVPLKISVGNYERPYNEANPKFELTYEGLVAKDTEASLQNKPVVRTDATKTSELGTYTLEVTGAYSPNYTITYGSGTLTIVKAEQALEWNQDLRLVIVDDQVELLAKASSGLPVTYTMESINGAELYPAGSKTYLECKSPCEFTITAVQNGDGHYYSTQRITKKVKIVKEEDYEKERQTAIEDVIADDSTYQIYTIDGKPIEALQKGVNIIKYQNGNVKKVLVK